MNVFIHIVLVTATFLTVSCEFAPEIINFITMDIEANNTEAKRYFFRDKQFIIFQCLGSREDFTKIKYIPQDAEHIVAGSFNDIPLSYLYIKMTRAQHKSVVECHVTDTANYNLKSIKKVQFEMAAPGSSPDEDFVGFEVNGLILPKISHNIDVNYPSYNGDHLKIKFLYNKERTNGVSCKFDGPILKDAKYAGNFNNPSDLEVIYKEEYSPSALICSVIDNVNNKTDYKLRFQNVNSQIPVVGLSFSKSLLLYVNNDTVESKKYIIMKYEYDSNSKLTCKPSLWIYNSSEVSCLAEQHSDGHTCTFNLINNHTKSIVQCYNMKIELNKETQNEPAFSSTLAANDKNGI